MREPRRSSHFIFRRQGGCRLKRHPNCRMQFHRKPQGTFPGSCTGTYHPGSLSPMRCACRCASAGPENTFRSTVIASVNIDRERTMRGSCLPSRPFQPAFPNRVFHVGKTGATSLADRCGTPVHDRPQGVLAGSKAGCTDSSFPDLPRRAALRTVEVRRGMASSFRRRRSGRFPTRSSWHIDVPFAIRRGRRIGADGPRHGAGTVGPESAGMAPSPRSSARSRTPPRQTGDPNER